MCHLGEETYARAQPNQTKNESQRLLNWASHVQDTHGSSHYGPRSRFRAPGRNRRRQGTTPARKESMTDRPCCAAATRDCHHREKEAKSFKPRRAACPAPAVVCGLARSHAYRLVRSPSPVKGAQLYILVAARSSSGRQRRTQRSRWEEEPSARHQKRSPRGPRTPIPSSDAPRPACHSPLASGCGRPRRPAHPEGCDTVAALACHGIYSRSVVWT